MGADAELRLEGLEDTTTLLRHMREMLVMHSPTLSSTRLRKVQEVANSAWRRFFKTRLEIRGDPLAVVAALEELAVKSAERVEELERRCAAASKGERERRNEVQGYKVAARRAEAEVERLRALSSSHVASAAGASPRATLGAGVGVGSGAIVGAGLRSSGGAAVGDGRAGGRWRKTKARVLESAAAAKRKGDVGGDEEKEEKEEETNTGAEAEESYEATRLDTSVARAAAEKEADHRRFPLSIGNRRICR